ncbi:TonB-dependent receptor plug domain-containing protein [Qipengyuania sp. NPDC077563]|uniref:TonB-dependent receptor plug domain-containing protein n=1 Tax=Qipengyuania sp. NPDC077563 TaxID=3364497 RepID=UPI00384CAB25
MKTVFYTTAAVAALAVCPTAAQAQSADLPEDGDMTSELIVVTANRTERAISQVGESVTVIAEDEIISRQATDALDLLRTVPGITFTRNGGIGTNANLSIRGADSDQTVVLIDGVKLNDPSSTGGGFNFGTLLTGNIARVEVVRGSQSVLYGSQAIGGVVNLITREPSEDLGVFLSAEYGERDSAELVGNLSRSFGPVAASVGATYFRTDGISAFSEGRGGEERDGFESLGVNGKLDVALADNISIDLRAFYADGKTDIDGFGANGFGDTAEVSYRDDLVGYAGLNADFLDGRLHNRIGFAYTNIDRRNFDFGSDSETFDAHGENRRYEYQGGFDFAEFAELVFGAEREESEFRSSSYGATPDEAEVWINSVYGQLNLAPFAGLSLTGGVRYDDHETYGDETIFSASGAYSPNNGATVVRASYGEGFKAPSLYQLYSVYGTAGLQPEESESWDAGITHRFLDGRAQAGVTYFERDSKNLIGFVSTDTDPYGYYDNTELTSAHGWEFGVALRPVDGFNVALNYTTTEAIDETTGNFLPRRATDKTSLVVDYRLESGIGLGATVLMVGDSFDNAGNSRELDGYVVTDLRTSYGIADNLEIFGRVENLFNAKYETVYRYGQPGRAAFGGVRYRL